MLKKYFSIILAVVVAVTAAAVILPMVADAITKKEVVVCTQTATIKQKVAVKSAKETYKIATAEAKAAKNKVALKLAQNNYAKVLNEAKKTFNTDQKACKKALVLPIPSKTFPPPTTNNGSSSPQLNNETANWKTYSNEQYGFELKYPIDFKLNQQYQEIYLSKENSENLIYISVGETLSVPLMGTFGGRYQYPYKYPDTTPIVPVFSEKYGSWKKDYFIVEGKGMWDTAINAYQNKNGSYYNISLYSSARQLSTPDAEAASLKDMRDSSDTHTNIFNQILSTFKFTR